MPHNGADEPRRTSMTDLHASRVRRRHRVQHAVVVLAFVVAIAITIVLPVVATDAPRESFVGAFRAASSLVRSGDVVLIHPPWREDAAASVQEILSLQDAVEKTLQVTVALSPRRQDPLPSLLVIADPRWPLPAVLQRRAPREVVWFQDVVVFRIDHDQKGALHVLPVADPRRASGSAAPEKRNAPSSDTLVVAAVPREAAP
jgi:hypothetical protein